MKKREWRIRSAAQRHVSATQLMFLPIFVVIQHMGNDNTNLKRVLIACRRALVKSQGQFQLDLTTKQNIKSSHMLTLFV